MSDLGQLTIGVAGHIDHGKTSLVKSITGKNTDNLKEEIKRGMTINVGFPLHGKMTKRRWRWERCLTRRE